MSPPAPAAAAVDRLQHWLSGGGSSSSGLSDSGTSEEYGLGHTPPPSPPPPPSVPAGDLWGVTLGASDTGASWASPHPGCSATSNITQPPPAAFHTTSGSSNSAGRPYKQGVVNAAALQRLLEVSRQQQKALSQLSTQRYGQSSGAPAAGGGVVRGVLDTSATAAAAAAAAVQNDEPQAADAVFQNTRSSSSDSGSSSSSSDSGRGGTTAYLSQDSMSLSGGSPILTAMASSSLGALTEAGTAVPFSLTQPAAPASTRGAVLPQDQGLGAQQGVAGQQGLAGMHPMLAQLPGLEFLTLNKSGSSSSLWDHSNGVPLSSALAASSSIDIDGTSVAGSILEVEQLQQELFGAGWQANSAAAVAGLQALQLQHLNGGSSGGSVGVAGGSPLWAGGSVYGGSPVPGGSPVRAVPSHQVAIAWSAAGTTTTEGMASTCEWQLLQLQQRQEGGAMSAAAAVRPSPSCQSLEALQQQLQRTSYQQQQQQQQQVLVTGECAGWSAARQPGALCPPVQSDGGSITQGSLGYPPSSQLQQDMYLLESAIQQQLQLQMQLRVRLQAMQQQQQQQQQQQHQVNMACLGATLAPQVPPGMPWAAAGTGMGSGVYPPSLSQAWSASAALAPAAHVLPASTPIMDAAGFGWGGRNMYHQQQQQQQQDMRGTVNLGHFVTAGTSSSWRGHQLQQQQRMFPGYQAASAAAGAAAGRGSAVTQHGSLPAGKHQQHVPAADSPSSDQLTCHLCNITCKQAHTLQQHLKGKRHLSKVAHAASLAAAAAAAAAAAGQAQAAVNAAAGTALGVQTSMELHSIGDLSSPSSSISSGGGGCSPGWMPDMEDEMVFVGPGAPVRDYCFQQISVELNTSVRGVLTTAKALQDQDTESLPDRTGPNTNRWYICGLREVRKAVKHARAHTIILAPDIEQLEVDWALSDAVDSIIAACKETNTPVVFALSRKKLGEIYGVRKRMSAIALLRMEGVAEQVEQMWALAEQGRRAWELNRGLTMA